MLLKASFPFLSVNLDFSQSTVPIPIGQDGVECSSVAGKVAKSCYVDTKIGKVGLIGRSPADFFNVIENPATNLPGIVFFPGSVIDQVLEQVDVLESQGVDIILLLNHAQDFDTDRETLRNELRGIDVIVEAGATGFQAKDTPNGPFNLLREGDIPENDYPLLFQDSAGDTVLTVNSDQLYTYVGHLIVEFDQNGKVVGTDDRSGPVASTEESVDLLRNFIPFSGPLKNARVNFVLRGLQRTPSIQASFEEVGTTDVALNGARGDVRSRETNLGRLAADSTLVASRALVPNVDIALKNGGGIRGKDIYTTNTYIRIITDTPVFCPFLVCR